MPKVVHCKIDPSATYVGRPTKWGNKFIIPRDGDRAIVIQKYADWIQLQPDLMSALPELKDKDLSCWCAPLACHADVLLDLANGDINSD